MLVLILAQIGPPAPGAQAVTLDDYPELAMRLHHQGAVTVELTVDTAGELAKCRTAISSGYPELDQASCDLIRKRAHWKPATDDAGQPIAFVYRFRSRWMLSGGQPQSLPDTERDVPVAAFPKDMIRPTASLAFIVAPDGKVESCRVADGQGTGSAALDQAACASLSKSETFPPVLDRDGKPVRFIRVQKVGFTAGPPK